MGDTAVERPRVAAAVRDVAEDHVLEDLGTIPSVEKWFELLPITQFPAFVGGPRRGAKRIVKID